MKFLLSASGLMKASQVREACKFMRENKHVPLKQEIQIKAEMYRRLSPVKEKAAS
ncbi:hypothetical protein J1P26_22785 [Neobacillus sp. MM2021_6]|uniref:hypothetical protein n=1 Tax=Bacillaceae TaxID=186817 RepID=UPI00140E58DB|nr:MULTISPECIES: hypothetical protein [Bacillaceae]MBO0962525.1 hypothetical protein [Neobacillus sp. MM2021_6]NHC20997.1 hypothetical protein [Bacillus sp. MM2020_4]